MSIFGPKMGTYWINSKSDPRFNKTWRRTGLVTTGIPNHMREWVARKCKKLGLENPPDDLEWGFIKD